MLKAIKVRLYPNNKQATQINKLLGSCRVVYNACLAAKIQAYTEDKSILNLSDLGKFFHTELTKDEEHFYLKEHNTKVLKQSIIDLLVAYQNFFRDKKVGFPNFKSKKDNNQSCRFPSEAISVKNDYLSGRLKLTSNLGSIKFRCSDEYKDYLDKYKDKIKSATLRRKPSGKYYLSILVDGDINRVLPETSNCIGIDLGIKDFMITSDGETFDNIKTIRNNEKKLIKLQRSVSRKKMVGSGKFKFSDEWQKDVEIKQPSKNRAKASKKFAKFNETLHDIKMNYLHQVSNLILSENQLIGMEDLNVQGMMKNHKLAKSIQELSLGEIRRILTYKAQWYGREIIFVSRYFASSKTCSNCGYKKTDLTLKDREWTCPECGTTHDRDINAAINILVEALRIYKEQIPARSGEFTLEETISVDDPSSNGTLKSMLSLNQEEREIKYFT
jgi:putative transposase